MKRKIFAVIGILWGALIICHPFFTNEPGGNAAYNAGGMVAGIVGVILFVASIYAFFKKPKASS